MRSRAAALFLAWLVISSSVATGPEKMRAKREVNIRSKENLELNCPSIQHEFPPGTIRCESCRAVGEALAFLVDRRSMDPLEATDAVCDRLLESAVLQQTRNGLRYWDMSGLRTEEEEAEAVFPLASNEDKVEVKGAKAPVVGTDGEPSDPFAVTYHTAEERVVLPCAHFFLKQYCHKHLEHHDEKIEECMVQFKKRVKAGAAEDRELLSRPKRAPVERGGKKTNREIAVEMLRHCLTVPLCEVHSYDCYSRIVAQKEEEEIERFRKYQGTYGAKQFPYAADRQDRKVYERNPFAPGGERVKDNELLRVPLEEQEL